MMSPDRFVEERTTTAGTVQPFRIDIPDEAIVDLRRRLAATRWPSKELVADDSQGVQLAMLQELTGIGRPSTTGAHARRG
jgi:hypothetical protein